jgi:hypothetical protein
LVELTEEEDLFKDLPPPEKGSPQLKDGNTQPEGAPPWIQMRPSLQSSRDLIMKEFPDERWLAEPVLPSEGVAILAAESGTQKTWLGLYLAICASLGQAWLCYPTTPIKVLYLNCEMPEREIQRRLRRLGVTANFRGHLDLMHGTFDLDDPTQFEELAKTVVAEKYHLIIGDTFSKLHSGRAEENNNDHMTIIMRKCKEIAYMSGGLFLLLHHISKPSSQYPVSLINRIRGASAIRDNATSILLLQKQGKGKDFQIQLTNPKNWAHEEAPPLKLRLFDDDADLSSFQWSEGETEGEDEKEDTQVEVIRQIRLGFLTKDCFPMTDLRQSGISDSAKRGLKSIVDELEGGGFIEVRKQGRGFHLVYPGVNFTSYVTASI